MVSPDFEKQLKSCSSKQAATGVRRYSSKNGIEHIKQANEDDTRLKLFLSPTKIPPNTAYL